MPELFFADLPGRWFSTAMPQGSPPLLCISSARKERFMNLTGVD